MKKSNYDKFPFVAAPGKARVWKSWPAICAALDEKLRGRQRAVLVVDTYPGVNDAELLGELESRLRPALTIRTMDLKKPEPELMKLIGGNLTDDRIFGVLSCHTLNEFFDPERLAAARSRVEQARDGLVLIYGVGAERVSRGDLLVYADMARWEIQLRYRRGLGNWGADNGRRRFFPQIQTRLFRRMARGGPA